MILKYELVKDDTIAIGNSTLFRIRAVADFSDIKAGDLGGYIQSEANLSHNGNSWIYDDACVYENARVYSNARVYENARVYGRAWVRGNAIIDDDAHVFDNSNIFDNAQISDNARVYGHARVYDSAEVYDDAEVYGEAVVNGFAEISGDARVESSSDYRVFKNQWSSFRDFTYTRSNRLWRVGCFLGTGNELVEKAYKDSELSGNCYRMHVYLVNEIYNDIEIKNFDINNS